ALPAAPTGASCPVPAPPPNPNMTWVRAATAAASPPARAAHAMVYDAARQRVVLFGGQWDSTFGDTWEWDGTRWRQIRPVTSPPPRSRHGMAYDAARRRVVLFGGIGSYGAGRLTDTWEYDGSTWVQRQPAVAPGGQYFHVRHMWYDSVAGSVRLLWESPDVDELWEWNGENWRRVTVAALAGTNPVVFLAAAERSFMAYAFDTRRGRLHMHGGRISFLRHLSDLWEFDGSAWRAISPGSEAPDRSSHAMAFDPDRGVMVLFGGTAPLGPERQPTNETWEWDGSRWVRVRPRVSPPAAEYPAMVYDAARREMVMFHRDTWVYRRDGP
ncbi:MAG TPA: kelch repeat-containing protein, partial [Gemmatimonadales bacterium]|nr:kelch repeat-containing protein [Gemmatimonadales bacterium]